MIKMPRKMVGIEPLYDKDTSPSGLIYIPESAKERCDQGLVKYIGEGCKNVKIGDHVIFSGYTGTNVRIDDEILIFLREAEISAIVEPQTLDVKELYFRDKDGQYFEATYEQAMYLIAKNLNLINRVDRSYTPGDAKVYHGARFSLIGIDEEEDDD